MSDLYSLVAGIALGLSLGIPPGPVNAAIAAVSARKSCVGGIFVGLGAMTADFAFLVLTLLGVAVLLTSDLAHDVISVVGGLILVYFAVTTLQSYRRESGIDGSVKAGNTYLTGLVLGLTNPLGILWWVTAGAAFVAMFNLVGVAGFMLGLLIWITGFALFVHFVGKKVKVVYPIIVIGSGLMMLFFGVLLLYDVVRAALGL